MDTTLRCINCGLCIRRLERHAMGKLELHLKIILAQWLSLPKVPEDEFICSACFTFLNKSVGEANPIRKLGHSNVCIGCGCSVFPPKKSRSLEQDSPFLDIFPVYYHMQNSSYQICHPCWMKGSRRLTKKVKREIDTPVPDKLIPSLTQNKVSVGNSTSPEPSPKHRSICPTDSLNKELCIEPMIEEPLIPNDESLSDPLCEQSVISVRQNTSPSEGIVLPNYKRAANTSSRCLFKMCKSKSTLSVPKFMKKICVKKYNFYIPLHARVCKDHITNKSNNWKLLPTMCNANSVFNVDQIEDLINLAKTEFVFDFRSIDDMPDHICHYWTGLNVLELHTLYNEHKHVLDRCVKHPKTSLMLYLTKVRTGNSNMRLSKLFQMSKSTVANRINKVKKFITIHNVQLKIKRVVPPSLRHSFKVCSPKRTSSQADNRNH